MPDVNYLAIAAAAVAAFIVSTVWYIVMLSDSAENSSATPAWKPIVEIARSLVLAYVLAYFVVELDVDDWLEAVKLGLIVWVGFPAVLFTGSVLWQLPPISSKLAAIHAGDWLVKLLIMSLIVGLWR